MWIEHFIAITELDKALHDLPDNYLELPRYELPSEVELVGKLTGPETRLLGRIYQLLDNAEVDNLAHNATIHNNGLCGNESEECYKYWKLQDNRRMEFDVICYLLARNMKQRLSLDFDEIFLDGNDIYVLPLQDPQEIFEDQILSFLPGELDKSKMN